MTTLEITSLAIGIVSAITAVVSVIFAWKATEISRKSNTASLVVELHQIYHSDDYFKATQTVYQLYKKYQSTADGTPITYQQALEYIQRADQEAYEWQAIHITSSFWRYVNLLLAQGFINETIALGAFTSPRILGFLYPIEKAFLELTEQTYTYENSLQRLHDIWQKSK